MTDQEFGRLEEAIRELSIWLRLAYGSRIREHLEQVLDTPEKLEAYEATDGNATTREIGELVGVDQKTISIWWRDWAREGLVVPGPRRKDRPQKVISLTVFRLQ